MIRKSGKAMLSICPERGNLSEGWRTSALLTRCARPATKYLFIRFGTIRQARGKKTTVSASITSCFRQKLRTICNQLRWKSTCAHGKSRQTMSRLPAILIFNMGALIAQIRSPDPLPRQWRYDVRPRLPQRMPFPASTATRLCPSGCNYPARRS